MQPDELEVIAVADPLDHFGADVARRHLKNPDGGSH
jgi:hypothetical protein